MNGYLCECDNCGVGDNKSFTDDIEFVKLASYLDYQRYDVFIVIRGHESGEDKILEETQTLFLTKKIPTALQEKISSLDTDQEIGNRE